MYFAKASALFALGGAFLSASALPIARRPVTRRQTVVTDFGSCGTPEVTFALGLDGRTDPAFQAIDMVSFNHGSALGIGVITSFICQQLNDKCKAPQATLDACASGQANAAAVTGGKAADAFNAAFGIITSFATTGPVQGNSGQSNAGGNGGAAAPADPAPTTTAAAPEATDGTDCPPPTTVTITAAPPTATEAPATGGDTTEDNGGDNNGGNDNNNGGGADNGNGGAAAPGNSNLDLGSCTNPTIEFGPAFEGRKASEFTFQPADKTEFPQGSALNGAIVANAICNILKDRCQAPAETVAACDQGKAAFDAAPAGGAKADAFNAALGFTTDFTNIPAAPGGGPGSAELAAEVSFGTCTDPTIVFGPGFDGRTEDSFQPSNKNDFNHGSALNGNIITTAICDTLINTCNANKNALDACAAAKEATAGLSGQAFADAFNNRILQDV